MTKSLNVKQRLMMIVMRVCIRRFDMEADGIRCASKKWEINKVRTLKE